MERTSTRALHLLLLEPNRLWREGLSRVLEDAGYAVTAAAGPLAAGLSQTARTGQPPDVAVVDASAISADPAAEFETVRARFPTTRLVVFTDPEAPGDALACFRAGADGCRAAIRCARCAGPAWSGWTRSCSTICCTATST
jgi:DNA-binding NarL/FixJ family response regulator